MGNVDSQEYQFDELERATAGSRRPRRSIALLLAGGLLLALAAAFVPSPAEAAGTTGCTSTVRYYTAYQSSWIRTSKSYGTAQPVGGGATYYWQYQHEVREIDYIRYKRCYLNGKFTHSVMSRKYTSQERWRECAGYGAPTSCSRTSYGPVKSNGWGGYRGNGNFYGRPR